MDFRGRVSRTAFEAVLTPAHIRTSQIIQAALMMGALVFLLAVLFVYSQTPPITPREAEVDTVRMMTFAHLALLVANIGIGFFMVQRMFSPEAMADGVSGLTDPTVIAERCAVQQRTAMLVRMALLEGSAFFGITVCMVGATSGVLATAPEYWINVLSPFLLVSFGIATFPTKERLAAWFEERFLAP